MKKVLLTAIAVSAMAAATPAAAQSETFVVSGTVEEVCSFDGGTIAFATITTSPDGTLPGTQDASATGQTGFYCNGANTTLTLAHTAMTTSATAAPGFTSTIDFTPAVTVGAYEQVGDVVGTAFGAMAGSLVVSARDLSTTNATDKVMAGIYSGSITLTLTPAF